MDAVDATPEDHPDRAGRLTNLGIQLAKRCSRTGTMADLEETIRVGRETVDATPEDYLNQAGRLNNLGIQLAKRYSRTGAMADLEEAIRVGREAVNAISEDYPDRAGYLSNLGMQLGHRFSRTGAIADIEEAIRVGRDAVDATPENHPGRAGRLTNLGIQLAKRYSRTGTMADLEEAIRIGRETVDTTPENHPNQAGYLNNLGIQLAKRYLRTGAMADIEEAIRVGREAVDATLEDHPNRAGRLNNLGLQLAKRHLRTGAMADIEEAIRVGREAVDATPEDHPGRAGYLNNLGMQLGDRYSRTGTMGNLEEAIRVGREAVDATPEDHPDRAGYLNNLGARLGDRFSKTGAMADLEEAIRVGREAVDAIPENYSDRAASLTNFGMQLTKRYSRTGAMADIEEAIRIGREAVDATPEDHPNRAIYLNNLGTRLGDRFLRTGTMADIEEAIRVGREAVNATPEDYPDRAASLTNLGLQLGDRFLRTGAMADIEEAIRVGRKAVDTIPENHPNRAIYLNNLGLQLGDRYLRIGAMADLKEAISYHQSALRQLTSSTVTRIKAGREVLQYCAIISDWQQAYEASDIAVHLIPKLTSRSLENSDKQHMLGQVVGLASDAAAAALHAEKGPLVALNFLEQGRGVLAASLEEIRTDVLYLQKRYPELAEQFVRLRDELELPVTRNTSFMGENRESSWQVQASRRYEAGNELDKLIIEIRKQPEFKDFLLAPSEGDMRVAAKYGPIVAINVSEYRCDAILVEQHQIRSLALPNLNRKDITEKAQANDLGSPKVLEWLWDVVMNSILDALRFTQCPSEDNWPHIWWIPTGPLSKFPLHTAGRHIKGSSETVLDRVMSSYSSSIKAIIHSRRRPVIPFNSAQALLVAMEHTPGNSRLPFATKEVAMLHGLCKSMTFNPIEPGQRKQDVISHLPQCKIFHFAGHGHTDEDDPSKSHLLLEDGKNDPLMVATLLEMNIREHAPFLAYLSACGTGQIRDEKFVDESIHLISACQLAGFRHVIGTLWEVNDELCVDMARITYEGMRDGGMTDESVCRGLHNATRELRDRWLTMPAKTRRGSGSVRKVDVPLVEDKTEARSASDGDQRDDRLPRDVVLCDNDDDDEGGTGSLHWVPYVHFGV